MTADIARLLDAMQARCDAATDGPWHWRNTFEGPMLLGRAKGLHLVMGFRRMGMQGAQPLFRDRENPSLVEEAGKEDLYSFPDAAFIASARTDLPRLIAAVRAVLELHAQEVAHLRAYDPSAPCHHYANALHDAVAALTTALKETDDD